MFKKLALLCLAACTVSLVWSQTADAVPKRRTTIGIDAFVGTPSAFADAFKAAFPGISVRWRATSNIELSLDYAFMDIGYYYPETASGPWDGPVAWSSMPTVFASREASWIFFHTKHFIAPQLWYRADLGKFNLPLALRFGIGPAFSFVIPNEAAEYYPGLSDAFDEFQQSFKVFLGGSARAGLETTLFDHFTIGMEYLFIVDSFVDLASDIARYEYRYLERAGNLLCFVGVRI